MVVVQKLKFLNNSIELRSARKEYPNVFPMFSALSGVKIL
jgi:hypothetical protein